MAAFVLVQPQPRAGLAARRLESDGHEAIELAFHQLVPINHAIAKLAIADVGQYDRIVFASPSSAAFSNEALSGRLKSCNVAAIGQGSATVLVQSGLVAGDDEIIRPRTPPFDSAALSALPAMRSDAIRSMLVVRGTGGRSDWIENYRSAGVRVDLAEIYRSEAVTPPSAIREKLTALMKDKQSPVVIVGSMSEFNALNEWLGSADSSALRHWLQARSTIVPHGRIAAALADAGWKDLHTTKAGQTLHQAALELA